MRGVPRHVVGRAAGCAYGRPPTPYRRAAPPLYGRVSRRRRSSSAAHRASQGRPRRSRGSPSRRRRGRGARWRRGACSHRAARGSRRPSRGPATRGEHAGAVPPRAPTRMLEGGAGDRCRARTLQPGARCRSTVVRPSSPCSAWRSGARARGRRPRMPVARRRRPDTPRRPPESALTARAWGCEPGTRLCTWSTGGRCGGASLTRAARPPIRRRGFLLPTPS
jgi:hypothetical protein